MSDHWDFYFTHVDSKPASMFLDLGIAEEIPDAGRPWMLWVSLQFQERLDNGFSSNDEAEVLGEIEDALAEEVANAVDGVAVGRVTTDGHRDFFYFAPSFAGFEDCVCRVMNAFPEYHWDSGSEEDPEWEIYTNFLYPSPYNWQEMKNRQVLEQLEEHGDSLEKERTVSHWAYFPDEAAQVKFAEAVRGLGYTVLEKDNEEAAGDEESIVAFPLGHDGHDHSECGDECGHSHEHEGPAFAVRFERMDKVDWASINAATIELLDLAESVGGEYDGWETSVER